MASFFSRICRSTKYSFRRCSSNLASEKHLKTIDDLPGYKSYYGLGVGFRILLAKLLTRKPLGAIALHAQFDETKMFGRIYRTQIPGVDMVNLSDPVEIAKILRNEPKYPRRFDIPVIDYYREIRNSVPGVFFANDHDWFRYRSTVSKRILKPREVAEYLPIFNEIVTDFITRLDAIRSPPSSQNAYEVRDLDNELFKWSFESVAHVLFDRRFGAFENEMNPAIQDFINSVGTFLYSVLVVSLIPLWVHKMYETKVFKDFVYHFDNMYKHAENFIDERIQELENSRSNRQSTSENINIDEEKVDENIREKVGFVEYLLYETQLSKQDILASMIDLFFAGVDTTSNTMQWIIYMLAKNPEKQEKLFQEISATLEPGELPTTSILASMPYLKACFKETLRLYPVLSITGRILPSDMEIMGYLIPKGTPVQFLNFYMGRCEEYFPNASKFLPERWMRNERKELVDTVQAFASIPFGVGTRMCAGRRIAELEMYVLAARLVQRYKLEYPENEIVEPLSRAVTIPDRPLRVRFIER